MDHIVYFVVNNQKLVFVNITSSHSLIVSFEQHKKYASTLTPAYHPFCKQLSVFLGI